MIQMENENCFFLNKLENLNQKIKVFKETFYEKRPSFEKKYVSFKEEQQEKQI